MRLLCSCIGDPVLCRKDEKTLLSTCRNRTSGINSRKALAPSLRQYELDQVQRVTAPRKQAVSQPLAGTPLVNASGWTGRRYLVKRIRAPSAGGDDRRPVKTGRRARACIGDKSRPGDQGWNGQSLFRFVKDGETVSAMCVEIHRVAQAVTDVVILVQGDDSRLQRGDLHLVQVDGVADNDLVVGLAGAGGRSIQDAASAAFPIPMISCGQLMQSPAS